MTPPTVETQLIAPTSKVSPTKREFWLVFSALTILYVVAVTIGNRRYVWFDELFTFNIARSASLQQLWGRELRFDCNPPSVYLLSRASMAIFGPTPFGLRFPSMAEFYLGSMAILLYTRRKAGIAFAAFAVLLLWAAAPTLYYAVEARPYALVFLSFACLLLSWDTAIHAQPRRLALLGVAISTVVLATAHVFAPFTLFAFVVAESIRFSRRRRPDYPLWSALLLPMLAMVIYLPLMRSCGGIIFPVHASYNTITIFFEDTLGSPIISIALLAVLLTPAVGAGETTARWFLAEEIALLGCMFLSPILLNLFLMHRQATFYNRYCLASQVAILVALAVLLPYRTRLNRLRAYAGSILLVLFILKIQVWHTLLYPVPRNAAFLGEIESNLPLVIGEGQVFMEMNQYENAKMLSRLFFLKDPQASMQYLHTNIFQDFEAPDVMQKAGFPFTANVAPYATFVHQHRQFLLLGSPVDWVFSKLLGNGATISFVGDYRGSMPYMDTTLYRVTMPSQ
jgi:hypothetical protein